jgi:putative membrane protein
MSTSTTARSRHSTAYLAVAAIAWFAVAACAKTETPPVDSSAVAPAPAPEATAPALTDADIAHVAVTANSVDSAAGEFAKPKATKPDVKEYAQMMIRDHGMVNKEATALAQKLSVTPTDNDVSRQLQQGANTARTNLEGKTGAEFDRAYIDREVEYHQAVLDALDKTLIPGAQNAELKALLEKVRPSVAAHLERAKSIQSTLTTTS